MKSVINWFEIPVADMDRAIKFYESVMQVALRREKMDVADLAIFPHQDPATGGALAKFDGVTPSSQGAIIYLHTDNLGPRSIVLLLRAVSACLARWNCRKPLAL